MGKVIPWIQEILDNPHTWARGGVKDLYLDWEQGKILRRYIDRELSVPCGECPTVSSWVEEDIFIYIRVACCTRHKALHRIYGDTW